MPQAKTWLKTDLSKPITVYSLENKMFTLDSQGNMIGVEVYDNDDPVMLTGTIIGYIIRADGNTVYVEGEISGNKAMIVLPAVAYAIIGQITIVIRCINGEEKTVIAACKAHVTSSCTDEIIDPGEVIPSLEDLPVVIQSVTTYYKADDQGTTIPTTGWGETIPTVNPGQYLWQKEVLTWNTDQVTEFYTVTRYGQNGSSGTGAVDAVKVNGTTYEPENNGIVDIGTVVTDVSGKADKVTSATSGNFAGLDSNGNLTDSGKDASDFAVPSTALTATLSSGSWSSSSPYTQTVSNVTGVTSSNNIIVTLSSTATSTQYNAYVYGKIMCTSQSTNSLTFTSYGTKPTTNIPISVLIMG